MMNKIGDVKKAREIGRNGSGPYIWRACIDCGETRWVRVSQQALRCRLCADKLKRGKHYSISSEFKKGHHQERGANNPAWKGGRVLSQGYTWIKLCPDDFFYQMTMSNSYIQEHRLVMARGIGRNLQPWEIVHHKGTKYPSGSMENRSDNRFENLQIIVTGSNSNLHSGKIICPYCQKEFRVR